MPETLLLVADDADGLGPVGDYLAGLGYDVAREGTDEVGGETYEGLRPDVVILDLQPSGAGAFEVLQRLCAKGAPVILLTRQGDIEAAVRAMQLGAENFLVKPVDLTHLAAATARAAEKARLARENALLRAALERGGVAAGGGERRHAALTLADVERQQIERSLRHHGGNRTRAAQELGISRATLINKIRVYRIDL